MKWLIVISFFFCLLSACYLCHYKKGLKPVLQLALDDKECFILEYNRSGMAVGIDVINLLKKHGAHTEGTLYFALKGKVKPRFHPDRFHGVKGDIDAKNGDPNKIYFYSYRKKYNTIVFEP